MTKGIILFAIREGGRRPTADMLLDGVCELAECGI
jgi:hypothetical protein